MFRYARSEPLSQVQSADDVVHPLISVSNVPFATSSSPMTTGVGHGRLADGIVKDSASLVTLEPDVGISDEGVEPCST